VSIRRPRPPRRPQIRLGLRARLALTYALGAALLSAVLSLTTFLLTRENLITQQEQAMVNQALRNVATVSDVIDPDLDQATLEGIVGDLATPGGAQPVLFFEDGWTARNSVRFGQDDIPETLRAEVEAGTPGKMRVEVDGEPILVVGVPIAPSGAYYEGAPLDDLQRTLEGLAISLLGASTITTLAGGLLGVWAARRVFAPLLEIGRAADAIAGGRLDTRLPVGSDRDVDLIARPFNHMTQALQDRLDRDARFASEVSHELRSPLMTLAAAVEVLENSREEMPDRARTALDLLSADVDRFQQLVEDLLEISRFDVGAIKLHLEPVLVAEVVIQAVGMLGGAGIPIRYDESVSETVVRIDKRLFARVLANLIDNAERYAGGPTDITITREGDEALIGVEDAGPGVSEQDRKTVFDRFSRGSEGGKRAPDSGVGLGLALVDEHIRLHGGRAWVVDRPDGTPGARFVVTLPIVEVASTEADPTDGAAVDDADTVDDRDLEVTP
jgi:two-component system sensor histidine kinase MtrB